jgi:hypothetical protein
MNKNQCDYYVAAKKDIVNCCNCVNWDGDRCRCADRVLGRE